MNISVRRVHAEIIIFHWDPIGGRGIKEFKKMYAGGLTYFFFHPEPFGFQDPI